MMIFPFLLFAEGKKKRLFKVDRFCGAVGVNGGGGGGANSKKVNTHP